MSTVKSKKLQVGTDATATNNFTIYQPSTPDGTLRIGVGNADSPTEVGRFNSNGYVATNAPIFSAYAGSNFSVSASTFTKIQYSSIEYDTNSCFDTSNYRFTPNVAGYYHFIATAQAHTSWTGGFVSLRRNGSGAQADNKLSNNINQGAGDTGIFNSSATFYLNGTTDYVEAYLIWGVTQDVTGARADVTFFQGHLVRAV